MASPWQKYEKFGQTNEQMFGPQATADATMQFMQLLQSSPMFAAMMGQAGLAGTAATTSLDKRLARSGMSGTGVGDIRGAVGAAIPQQMRQQAMMQMFQQAAQMGQQNVGQRATMSSYFANNQDWRGTWEKMWPGLLAAGGMAAGNPNITGGIKSLFSGGGGGQRQGGGNFSPSAAYAMLTGAGMML